MRVVRILKIAYMGFLFLQLYIHIYIKKKLKKRGGGKGGRSFCGKALLLLITGWFWVLGI